MMPDSLLGVRPGGEGGGAEKPLKTIDRTIREPLGAARGGPDWNNLVKTPSSSLGDIQLIQLTRGPGHRKQLTRGPGPPETAHTRTRSIGNS